MLKEWNWSQFMIGLILFYWLIQDFCSQYLEIFLYSCIYLVLFILEDSWSKKQKILNTTFLRKTLKQFLQHKMWKMLLLFSVTGIQTHNFWDISLFPLTLNLGSSLPIAYFTFVFRLMLGLMFITMFLSMWISNTATTAMMVPIVEAVLKVIVRDEPESSTLTLDTTLKWVLLKQYEK